MIRTGTENKIHRVLWTGGFDSTYRMIELALQDVIVEPIYVVNSNRRSHNIELSSMQTMLEMLRSEPFKATIRDIKLINKDEIEIDEPTHLAFARLQEVAGIGPQYEWLAALAQTIPNLEICIEKAPQGRLHSRDVILAVSDDAMRSNDAKADDAMRSDVTRIFGNFIYPIFDKTEDEMMADIREWGCDDVIEHIWFCNHPLMNGEPCGMCNPCRIKIDSGMKQFFTDAALQRNLEMRKIEMEQGEDSAREYRVNYWTENGRI